MTGNVPGGTRLRRTLFGARWAAVYLVVAGALIAIAGSEVSSPTPEEHAREIELRSAKELGTLAEAAAAVADSVARERTRLEAERDAKLESALAAARSWLHASTAKGGEAGEINGTLARSAGKLAPLVPAGIAVAVLGSGGEPILECGGRVDLDSSGVRVGPAWGTGFAEPSGGQAIGLTLAVAWTEALPEAEAAASAALVSALGSAPPSGVGLYFVGPEGASAAEVTRRPVSAAPLAPTFDAQPRPKTGSVPYIASGDLETGKLLAVRRATSMAGWTAVAERFMTPEELAEGAPTGFGMIALTALGLVAAGAFAHAVRAGVLGNRHRSEEDGDAGLLESEARRMRSPPHAAHAPRPVMRVESAARQQEFPEAQTLPTGRSILRLREALGTPAEGPDIAACARSPILRALSKYVRAPNPVALPREVRDWGMTVARPPGGARIKLPDQLRKSA